MTFEISVNDEVSILNVEGKTMAEMSGGGGDGGGEQMGKSGDDSLAHRVISKGLKEKTGTF